MPAMSTSQIIIGDVQQQQQQKQQQQQTQKLVVQIQSSNNNKTTTTSHQKRPQKQQQTLQQQQQVNPPGAIQLVDGATLVPTESLITSQQQQVNHLQQQQQHHHHPQMATIVTAAGAAPILVPSTQPVGPIAVAIAPSALVNAAGQVIDFAQLNSAVAVDQQVVVGGELSTTVDGGVVPVGGAEYFIQTAAPVAGTEVMHGVMGPDQMIMTGGGPVAATSDGTPIPYDQLKQLLQTQLEYYFSR